MTSDRNNRQALSCEQFRRRMDELLDDRRDAATDAVLRNHADDCSTCRDALRLWSQVDLVFSGHADRQDPPPVRPAAISNTLSPQAKTALTLAAAVLLLLGLGRLISLSSQPENRIIASAELPESSGAMAPLRSGGDETSSTDSPDQELANAEDPAWRSGNWWIAVADDRWVQHTLPAVDSVRQSVAPIGRSMKQAIAILMTKNRVEQIRSPVATPTIEQPTLDEQTSIFEHTPDIRFLAQTIA